jgi:hypothetical protein
MRPWGTAFKMDCLYKIRKYTQIDSDLESKPPDNRKTFAHRLGRLGQAMTGIP